MPYLKVIIGLSINQFTNKKQAGVVVPTCPLSILGFSRPGATAEEVPKGCKQSYYTGVLR